MAGGAGTVIFTPTNPKVTQTVSGAAELQENFVFFTHQGFFNIDKAEHRQQFAATQPPELPGQIETFSYLTNSNLGI